ncbi:MAG: hypothetical protein ABI047_02130 [Jatrophihabitantaceae bacterium]
MVLLNRLLVDCGFSPVLMERTDIFGGAFSEIELVAAIELGFRKFAHEVNLAPPVLDELVVDQLGIALLEVPADDEPRLLLTTPVSTAPVSKEPVLKDLVSKELASV